VAEAAGGWRPTAGELQIADFKHATPWNPQSAIRNPQSNYAPVRAVRVFSWILVARSSGEGASAAKSGGCSFSREARCAW
jgi:hypothetical protein